MYIVSDTDQELIAALQKGDEAAFKTLYEKYWAEVYTMIYRRIGDVDDSKDIVQNIFVNIWISRKNIIAEKSLAPWLNTAARTKAISHYKKKYASINRDTSFQNDLPEHYSPEFNLEAKELESVFKDEIEKMPDTMQKTFLLSRYENKSIREIAIELSLSEQTIKNNISQALERLRRKAKTFYAEPANLAGILIFLLTKK
ncbi:sigma-70 family RNA polymerase sigma factor [Mucilaginibacter sp. HC2]|jgi:RNA polymerase sigma-70 factor (ECF subfamily)|uniref:RNA polymerase sigma factor n=1 Tax=Mucilaginibacter inviolabilis TaxID=2714892 RepID=UPI00140C8AA4|nr:sigma-70 family RNA polymerase sigma factor [Mucilaginibacter inviolabilis]NHA05160.1 sigma-70 family RNA polymerase sigma factor [Mucilaginibacter inviolabilis]